MKPAAEQRPGHAGDAEDRAEVALVPAALAGRNDVADDAEGDRHQPAAADALQGAEGDQLGMFWLRPQRAEPIRKMTIVSWKIRRRP